ncbi:MULTISPECIES: hypothetical protein [unclassified Flavobacterium]|uniref:hypothetical protein n=1 Tax=unclassified Flavobacterium TaxID=196869 RepID=UPI003620BC16
MKTIRFFTLAGTLLLQMLTSCESQRETEVKTPHNIIPVQKGIIMKESYQNDIQRIIERNREQGTYQATEFAWINLDSLKNYIALLDKVSKLNNQKVSGVRIYFSQYPVEGNYTAEERERLIPGRETLFFAPTTTIAPTATTKRYPILENVPFAIERTGTNPYVGNFKVISRLLGRNEREINRDTTPTRQSFVEESQTSILLNELAMYPPPKSN